MQITPVCDILFTSRVSSDVLDFHSQCPSHHSQWQWIVDLSSRSPILAFMSYIPAVMILKNLGYIIKKISNVSFNKERAPEFCCIYFLQ